MPQTQLEWEILVIFPSRQDALPGHNTQLDEFGDSLHFTQNKLDFEIESLQQWYGMKTLQ